MKTPSPKEYDPDDPHKMTIQRFKAIVVNKITEEQAEERGIPEEARSAKPRK